jgi:tripartite-type tricarboxylate transporter receptor subunit TctC
MGGGYVVATVPTPEQKLMIARALSGCALGFAAVSALAADVPRPYPERPIRFIVPFPAGGATDIVARAVGQKLTDTWGQQVVIDNRGGAGGVIGTETAARAAPDGYTMLLGASSGMVVNPLLSSRLSYHPTKDFAPVSLLVVVAQLLVVNASVPVSSVKELIAYAKARPGQLNYASVGQGSPNHLGMELFKSMAGIDMVHVPYKGTGPALTELLGGQVQVMFNSMLPLMPHIRTGKLKPIAVSSGQRVRAAPDVPTVSESGVPGFETISWYGIFVPTGTSAAIIGRLNAEAVKIMADPDMAQRMTTQGMEPRSSTPAELTRVMQVESARWKKAIAVAGVKVE